MGQWILRISVSGRTVSFYIGVAGNNWTVQLRNSVGTVLATTTGTSYGDYTIEMPVTAPSGTYTLWAIPDYPNAEQNGTNFEYVAVGGIQCQSGYRQSILSGQCEPINFYGLTSSETIIIGISLFGITYYYTDIFRK